jgi:hypothetical protein
MYTERLFECCGDDERPLLARSTDCAFAIMSSLFARRRLAFPAAWATTIAAHAIGRLIHLPHANAGFAHDFNRQRSTSSSTRATATLIQVPLIFPINISDP